MVIFVYNYFCQVYSTSMAMLLTMVLSIYLFNFKPTMQVSLKLLGIVGFLNSQYFLFHILVSSDYKWPFHLCDCCSFSWVSLSVWCRYTCILLLQGCLLIILQMQKQLLKIWKRLPLRERVVHDAMPRPSQMINDISSMSHLTDFRPSLQPSIWHFKA